MHGRLRLARTHTRATSWLGGAAHLVPIPEFSDSRGNLLAFEFDTLSFDPRRAFVVSGVPIGQVRGRHALRAQHQLLVCVSGRVECEMRLADEAASTILDRADVGLLIAPGVWGSQRYLESDSVLVGFASGDYGPDEYAFDDSDGR